MSEAHLGRANFSEALLVGTDLSEAHLSGAQLVDTDLSHANLSGCSVYGTSVWNVTLDGATQTNIRITPLNEPEITVDNLEVAQFLYLMLHNDKIR